MHRYLIWSVNVFKFGNDSYTNHLAQSQTTAQHQKRHWY